MRVLKPLDVKVLRDLAGMRAQLFAIVAVIACGVGVYVGMRATMRSLDAARSSYFAHERFANVFASLKRAPEHVARKIETIPGVTAVQTRVVAEVTLTVPGLIEAATGRLISIPDSGRPAANDLRLRSGRFPEAGRWEEVLVSEAFQEAHDLRLGDSVGAIINGSHEELLIVGTALSPEYLIALGPGQIFPDDKSFGVFWMRRKALGTAFDMDGAFNDVALRLARDAQEQDVIARVDAVLERYGGLGAIARKDQLSAYFIENELVQLRTFALMLPVLFLLVAAFLLNVVFGRIIAGQREEIAALKAFGYRDREIGAHYAKLVGAVLFAGCAVGVVFGAWIGVWMTRLYVKLYRFPELPFELGASDAIEGSALAVIGALLGTFTSIRRTMALPPAEAMRPESPPNYRATLVQRLGIERWTSTTARMVLRELERRPLRASLSVLGIALATGLTVLTAFTFDSVTYMLNLQYGLTQHEDVQVILSEPRAVRTLHELEHLPGVLLAEPFRSVPVKLRNGRREKQAAITGLRADGTLTALLDVDLVDVGVPPEGLVLSRKLAELLDVACGDQLRVQVLVGSRPVLNLPVARIVETFVGTSAHMELGALSRGLGETESFNGAWLLADDSRIADLHERVKRTPMIAGAMTRDSALVSAQEMIDENLGTWVGINFSMSLVMAFGVLYNAVRITLSERSRDLASLRVLGFRRREVTAILLGEIGVLVAIAIPLGLAIGRLLAGWLAASPGFNNEQFRLPLVVSRTTYGYAVVTVLVAGAISAWAAWRKLERVDIVEVLKSHD